MLTAHLFVQKTFDRSFLDVNSSKACRVRRIKRRNLLFHYFFCDMNIFYWEVWFEINLNLKYNVNLVIFIPDKVRFILYRQNWVKLFSDLPPFVNVVTDGQFLIQCSRRYNYRSYLSIYTALVKRNHRVTMVLPRVNSSKKSAKHWL